MPGQVSEETKEQRNQELLATVDDCARRKSEILVGTRQQILCEGRSRTSAEHLSGRTPQNKIVVFEGDPRRHTGELFDVAIEHSSGFTLYGTPALA